MAKSRGPKAARTREHILEVALGLFRKRGFDETTMRQIASAAGLALGAAYYYFPSKEAIVLAYYAEVVASRAARLAPVFAAERDLAARLRAVYHVHLDALRRDRKLLGGLVRAVADPASEVSVFGPATAAVRAQSLALYREAVSVDAVPAELRELGALGLWTLDLAFILYFVWDESPKQEKTRELVDRTIALLVPMLPLFGMPFAAPLLGEVRALLEHAGLVPSMGRDR
jgi:AcrR family transcriptional regulator